MTDARASGRESAPAERESDPPPAALPTPAADIQPPADSRVRRSPTKSDSVRDASSNDSKSRVRGSSRSRDLAESTRASEMSDVPLSMELEAPVKVEKVKKVEPEIQTKVEKVKKVEPEVQTKVEKLKKVDTETPVKAGRSKKVEPVQTSLKVEKIKKVDPVPKESAPQESRQSVPREIIREQSIPKELPFKEKTIQEPVYIEPILQQPVAKEPMPKELTPIGNTQEEPAVSVTLKVSTKKKVSESKTVKEKVEKKEQPKDEVKTEEQAWDMLLNEPDKPIMYASPPTEDKVVEEAKPKTKKSRKSKKSQDDSQPKEEEDTFVEIHAIEDKQQESSGDLVSISTPYEELEPISYLAKAKKSRASKSITPERKDQYETRDIWGLETELSVSPKYKRNDDDIADIGFVPEVNIKTKSKEIESEVFKTDTLRVSDVAADTATTVAKDSSKPKKTKSLSPYSDRKSTEKRYENEVTDVYVIDTMKEEFPEIQITKGKTRKKSPQPEKTQEVEIVEKPIKSWSSIAASKNVKKDDKPIEVERKPLKVEKVTEVIDLDEQPGSSTQVSLQEKLIELCKRTDIMVAECDAPTELNFVDEHHSVLDLPPLEPLDFGLDDFKLEVMRDSLLDVGDTKITSPICKINIDSILSTIKETTNKAIESSAFNLIDLEKMPVKKEKGFSVVENDKITSQEVKIDDDKFEDKDVEVMEKSSDDDNASPVVSTDSDKEDKKSTGASNITMPSTKQSSKSKKSRKKKK